MEEEVLEMQVLTASRSRPAEGAQGESRQHVAQPPSQAAATYQTLSWTGPLCLR